MSKLIAKIPRWTQAAVTYSSPILRNVWKYSKVELRPPTPGEIGKAIPLAQKGFSNLTTKKFTEYSVGKVAQNTLVATEVLMWFFVGEMIGRWSIIGYTV